MTKSTRIRKKAEHKDSAVQIFNSNLDFNEVRTLQSFKNKRYICCHVLNLNHTRNEIQTYRPQNTKRCTIGLSIKSYPSGKKKSDHTLFKSAILATGTHPSLSNKESK